MPITMHWIYLSPHLDDVALSVGGLLWEQARAGDRVEIWTICAGDPAPEPFSPFAESMHTRWGVGRDAVAIRREEDRQSCAQLGAGYQHFSVQDCIYRKSPRTGAYLYASEDSIFGDLHPDDDALIEQLSKTLAAKLPEGTRLVCPIAIGGHVDHQLTRAAAQKLGISLWYYADYPYAAHAPIVPPQGAAAHIFPVSATGVAAWQNAVAAHHSQISTFWGNIQAMQNAILVHTQTMQGVKLWH